MFQMRKLIERELLGITPKAKLELAEKVILSSSDYELLMAYDKALLSRERERIMLRIKNNLFVGI